MSRSKWKGPFINTKSIEQMNLKTNSPVLITRNSEIAPNFMGLTFKVYNGKIFNELIITNESMIGHKFGEFVFTRSQFIFKKKKSKKSKK